MLRTNLLNERKQRQFTQADTAKAIGITVRQYINLEAGTSYGSVKVWQKLSKLFCTTIDYLLEQEDETTNL